MSKKELLNETQIRRFMKLANLEPLVKNVLSEASESEEERKGDVPNRKGHLAKSESVKEEMNMEADKPAPVAMEAEEKDGEDEMELDVGGDADPDKAAAFEAAVKALADSLGIEVEMGEDEGGEEEGGEEDAGEMDMGADAGEEEMPAELEEAKKEEEEEELDEAKKEKEDMEESVSLSEDSLVEAVLARVTARLVAEAKKKKMSAKEKMKAMKDKKAAKKDKVMEEATSAEGGGPLLKQGKNKHDTYKGHADMAYAKGKEGKGGHQMETLSAKAEHTVTHGGKNLATLGGNKKKV